MPRNFSDKLKQCAMAVAFVCMGVLLVRMMPTGRDYSFDAQFYVDRIKPITSAQAGDILASQEGKGTLLYIYASWCGTCRLTFGGVQAAASVVRESGVRLLAISIDDDRMEMAEYLLSKAHSPAFTPYILEAGERAAFGKLVRGRGGSFNGGIPYMALVYPGGKVVWESKGVTLQSTLQKAISSHLLGEGG